MKKILAVFCLMVASVKGAEILDEFYVMSYAIPFIQKGDVYEFNGTKVMAKKVDMNLIKSLKIDDNPFYFYDSNKLKTKAKVGDYLITPLNLSEIYSVDGEKFEREFIKY